MESNIDSGAPPPPQSTPSAPEVTGQEILAMDSQALEGHLQEMLHRIKPDPQPEEPAEDGSLPVESLVAVWLISQVSHAVGQQKLIKLSEVEDNEDLRSLKGVTRLVSQAFAGFRAVQDAS